MKWILFLLCCILCCWKVSASYDYEYARFVNKLEEEKKHEQMIKMAPQYMRYVMKDVILYPYTKNMIQNNGPVRLTFRYDGTVAGFSSVINETMYNADIIAEYMRDLSFIILKELEYHFDDYGVGYFDGIMIAQHYGTIIGIAKTTNETVDWTAFKGRCVYVMYCEVKSKLEQRIENESSKIGLFSSFELLIMSLPCVIIITCVMLNCFRCLMKI